MKLVSLNPQQVRENMKWVKHFEGNYKFQFLGPAYKEVPHVSQFFADERIIKKIKNIEYYLIGTYPIDMGTDIHKEMNDISHGFSEDEYDWHKEHNKLGINRYGRNVGISLLVLNKLLGRTDLKTAELFPKSDNYPKMSFREKLEFSSFLDKKVYSLLEKMYVDYGRVKL